VCLCVRSSFAISHNILRVFFMDTMPECRDDTNQLPETFHSALGDGLVTLVPVRTENKGEQMTCIIHGV